MVMTHMICSLLSYVAFLAAFFSGVLFLIQEWQLKHKRMGLLFYRLPSLEQLDRVNFLSVGWGFALLTIGFMAGLMGEKRLLGRWWSGDPKEYLTLAVWCSYLALWLVRFRATLRGRRVALLSVLGFSLVLFTFVGVSLLLPTWHVGL